MNRFSVKQTRNQNESITFLASMTSLLEDVYLHRTLSSCTKEDQESGLVKDPETTLITFKEFYVNSRYVSSPQRVSLANNSIYHFTVYFFLSPQEKSRPLDQGRLHPDADAAEVRDALLRVGHRRPLPVPGPPCEGVTRPLLHGGGEGRPPGRGATRRREEEGGKSHQQGDRDALRS